MQASLVRLQQKSHVRGMRGGALLTKSPLDCAPPLKNDLAARTGGVVARDPNRPDPNNNLNNNRLPNNNNINNNNRLRPPEDPSIRSDLSGGGRIRSDLSGKADVPARNFSPPGVLLLRADLGPGSGWNYDGNSGPGRADVSSAAAYRNELFSAAGVNKDPGHEIAPGPGQNLASFTGVAKWNSESDNSNLSSIPKTDADSEKLHVGSNSGSPEKSLCSISGHVDANTRSPVGTTEGSPRKENVSTENVNESLENVSLVCVCVCVCLCVNVSLFCVYVRRCEC